MHRYEKKTILRGPGGQHIGPPCGKVDEFHLPGVPPTVVFVDAKIPNVTLPHIQQEVMFFFFTCLLKV